MLTSLCIYKSLKESIERQKEKVILISHSLGGMFLHQFLLEQTLEWKKNHIDKLITINCPYGGSIESFDVLLNNKIILKRLSQKYLPKKIIKRKRNPKKKRNPQKKRNPDRKCKLKNGLAGI